MANETMQWPNPGLGSVGAYQMSGIPYVTASLAIPALGSAPVKVQFPYVVKTLIVKNVSGVTSTLRVGFSALGVTGSNYFILDDTESYNGSLRIEDVFLLSNTAIPVSASIIAELTPIPRGVPSFLSDGTGNNWSGSSGVG